jgi:hypothetical protein
MSQFIVDELKPFGPPFLHSIITFLINVDCWRINKISMLIIYVKI